MTSDIAVVEAVVVEPAERCPAATGRPADPGRGCRVHPDGAHRCYRSPTHQRDARDDARPLPDGLTCADHVCDCDFAWSSAPPVNRRGEGFRPMNHERNQPL